MKTKMIFLVALMLGLSFHLLAQTDTSRNRRDTSWNKKKMPDSSWNKRSNRDSTGTKRNERDTAWKKNDRRDTLAVKGQERSSLLAMYQQAVESSTTSIVYSWRAPLNIAPGREFGPSLEMPFNKESSKRLRNLNQVPRELRISRSNPV